MLFYSAQFLLQVYYRANTDSGFQDSSRDAHDGQWLFLVQFVNQNKRVSIMCLWQIDWVFIEIYVHLGHFPLSWLANAFTIVKIFLTGLSKLSKTIYFHKKKIIENTC